MHVSLDSVEAIVSDDVEWGSDEYFHRSYELRDPFQRIAQLSSDHAQQRMSLEQINKEPHLVGIFNGDRILLRNLGTKAKFSLKCHRWSKYPEVVCRLAIVTISICSS